MSDGVKFGELISKHDSKRNKPRIRDAKSSKKFFSSCLNSVFTPEISSYSRFGVGDIVAVARNEMTHKHYVETWV